MTLLNSYDFYSLMINLIFFLNNKNRKVKKPKHFYFLLQYFTQAFHSYRFLISSVSPVLFNLSLKAGFDLLLTILLTFF